MKKLISTVISAVMLLTMTVAMPVLADTEEVNLVVNPSFDLANDGVTIGQDVEFNGLGWVQTNPDARYYWRLEQLPYLDPDGTYMIHDGKKNSTPSKSPNAGLKQEIILDPSADWYINQDKYKFNLSVSGYSSAQPNGSVTLTAYAADGTSTTKTYVGGTDFVATAGSSRMFDEQTIDVTDVIDGLEGKAVRIDIELKSNEAGDMGWNVIKLVPEYDGVNLIVNGSFDIPNEGVTPGQFVEFDGLGWVQTNPDARYYWRVKQEPWLYPDGIYMIHDQNSATGVSPNAGLKQEIILDQSGDWYINQDKYNFNLSVSGYSSNQPNGSVTLTAYAADGTSTTKTYVGGTDFVATAGSSHMFDEQTIDVTDVIDGLEGKAVQIDIELKSNELGDMGWNVIKLVPVKKIFDVTIVDGNGADVNEIVTAEDATFIANATYAGSDAGAYAYIAVYSVNNGVYRLVAANAAPFVEGVAAPKVEGVDTIAGTTVVKAFIWDSQGVSVIGEIAD